MRGDRFYYRKTLPADIQRLTGRTEVWRSLGTDSERIAMRRLPVVIAQLEAEIEVTRHKAGLIVDDTLLGPFADDIYLWISSSSLNAIEVLEPIWKA